MNKKTCRTPECERKPMNNRRFCYNCIRKKDKEKKLEKLAKAKERNKKTKKYQKSLTKTLHRKAWRLMSEHIRRKWADSNGNVRCYTCGAWRNWKAMHCGHYHHRRLDLDDRNLKPQCPRCNHTLSGNLIEYGRRLLRENSQEWMDKLYLDANTKGNNYSINEYEEIIQDLTLKISKL